MDNRRIKITWEPVSVTDKDSLVQIIKHELDRLIKATEEGPDPFIHLLPILSAIQEQKYRIIYDYNMSGRVVGEYQEDAQKEWYHGKNQ